MEFQAAGSRRQFLSTVAVTAGAAILLRPRSGWAADITDPRVADIVAKTIGIDTHNHIDVPLTAAEMPGPDIDLAGEMKRSGLSAICMTFATDYQPGDAYDRFLKGLESMDRQLQRNGMTRSLKPADVGAAQKKGQPTVIQAVEGCHFLQGHIERVEEAYKRGLRHLGLLHDSDASVPLGDVYTNPPRFGGLTAFGTDVIKEVQQAGHAHRSGARQCANHGSRAQDHDPAGHHFPYRSRYAVGEQSVHGGDDAPKTHQQGAGQDGRQCRGGDRCLDASGRYAFGLCQECPGDGRCDRGRSCVHRHGYQAHPALRWPRRAVAPAVDLLAVALPAAVAPVNRMHASENAPIWHGRIKRPGFTTSLSMRC